MLNLQILSIICAILHHTLAGVNDCDHYSTVDDTSSIQMIDNTTAALPINNFAFIHAFCKYGYTGSGKANEFYSRTKCVNKNYRTVSTCRKIKNESLKAYCQWDKECTSKTKDSHCKLGDNQDLRKIRGCTCLDLTTRQDAYCVKEMGRTACLFKNKPYLEHIDYFNNRCFCNKQVTRCYKATYCRDYPDYNKTVMLIDMTNPSLPMKQNIWIYGLCRKGYTGNNETYYFYSRMKCVGGSYQIDEECTEIIAKEEDDYCQWNEECEMTDPSLECRIPESQNLTMDDRCKCISMDLMEDALCVEDNEVKICLYTDNKPYIEYKLPRNITCFCERILATCVKKLETYDDDDDDDGEHRYKYKNKFIVKCATFFLRLYLLILDFIKSVFNGQTYM